MKKFYLVFAMLIAATLVAAQDYSCETLIETTTDRMTGKTSHRSVVSIPFQMAATDKSARLTIYKSRRAVDLYFKFTGTLHCIDQYQDITILMRDGQRIKLKNDNSYNCDGLFVVSFINTASPRRHARTLAQKEIQAFRVSARSGFFEVDLFEHQSKTIMHTINCLLEIK
jgi:hypothetical protein